MSPRIHAAHPCPVCGYLAFAEPPGSDDICMVCGWQDDQVQLRWPTMAGGANKTSLIEAQRNFSESGAENPEHPGAVPNGEGLVRDPDWRPIDPSLDTFEQWPPTSRTEWPDKEALYYWLDSFWRR